ncbi:MAG: serine/threonine protein kinase, partial [Planctomycetaceae bacterium]|nr:serine/threonine protein kinase [Planctomycetaceae bacterium]
KNYRILRKLSSGGQGVVFHAWHTELNREVAIKVCQMTQDPQRQSRGVSEGALLAKVNDPRIARVHDLDLCGDRSYLVMEYVAGRNLRQVMQMSPPNWQTRLRIMRELAEAVAAAHKNGVLHLDLKPENVMLDEQGRVKLIDFGTGWLLPEREPTERLIAGTFAYMAPEQVRGQTSCWSSRTDVYGLGAVLYFLFTGRPPVAVTKLRSTDEHEQAIRDSLTGLGALGACKALQDVCQRTLDPDPRRRFHNAQEFLVALNRIAHPIWPARLLIAAGLCCILIAALIPFPQTQAASFASPTVTTKPATPRGLRLRLAAHCDLHESLTIGVWVPKHGFVPLRGLEIQCTPSGKRYRPKGDENGVILRDIDWAVLLALKSTEPIDAELLSRHLQDLERRFSPPHEETKEFEISPDPHTELAQDQWSFVDRFRASADGTTLSGKGVYIQIPELRRGFTLPAKFVNLDVSQGSSR